MSDARTYDLHIHFFPAEDLPGIWVAHCLDIDVFSQGRSLGEAMAMIREALELTVADDLAHGRDPLGRRAPKEDWDALWREAMPGTSARPIDSVLEHQDAVRHVVILPSLTVHKSGIAGTGTAVTSYDEPSLAFAPDFVRVATA